MPPFDDDEAYAVLRRELGVADLGEVFSSLSESPVASASIGQVGYQTVNFFSKKTSARTHRMAPTWTQSLWLFWET